MRGPAVILDPLRQFPKYLALLGRWGSEALIPKALDRLIALYTAANKPGSRKKYEALRAEYRKPNEKK